MSTSPIEPERDELAAQLRAAARTLPYPPTPDLATRLRTVAPTRSPSLRPLRLVLAALVLLAALLAVPEVRAAALRILQIGAVRVRVEPGPSPTPLAPTASPAAAEPLVDLGLVGAIPVDEAAERVAFPVRVPTYPPDLGPPDLAFLQDLDGEALVLVWLDPADPSRPRMSLHTLTSEILAQKTIYGPETELLAETAVHGVRALWVRGPHLLETGRAADRGLEMRRIVQGDTLLWTADGLTYRLETELPLEEAVLVAESLRERRP